MTTRRCMLAALGGIGIAAAAPARAQAWPARPLRMLVAAGAGGASDTFGRLIATELSQVLKQPVVVENRPGASGRLATEALLSAPNDGHTLLLSFASAIVPIPTLYPAEKNDRTKLQPVARFGSQGAFVVVTPDVPARDLRGFVEWARANREPVNYASYGIGSGGHIVMEAFARRAGLQLNHVPYKEVVKIMADMQGGSIRVAAVDPVTPLPLLRQGKLFALGVNGRYRLPANPEVATMSEQGFPIFMESWYGFFLPRGAPTPVVERLNTEVARVVQTPEMLERFRQLNLASTPSISPDEFARFVESEVGVWGKVITDAGIRVE